jgi:hypothetical protein
VSVPWRPVTPHTSSKLRQEAGCASTCCHISCSFGPHLPAEVGFDATTCPTTPDLASLLRWASALPRVPQLRTLPPWWGELRCCHVSHGSGLCIPERGAPVLSRVPQLGALPSWEGSFGASTCLTAPGGLWSTGIKECLVTLVCFQGTLVRYRSACKTCRPLQCGSIMQRRPTWSLLDMAAVMIWPDRTAPRRWPCSIQLGGRRQD